MFFRDIAEKISQGERDAAVARISTTLKLPDLGRTDLVIEAATENLDLKRKIFKQIDEAAPPPPKPGDKDGDGILDNEDLCPTEPENWNGYKEAKDDPLPDGYGCPDDPDTDIIWTWSGNSGLRVTWDAVRRRITVRPLRGFTGTGIAETDPVHPRSGQGT